MSGPDDSAGDFWSRRKAAVRAAEAAEQAERTAEAEAAERAQLEEKTDEEILEELGLQDPDSLTEKDDFSRFLGSAVPDRLRRRALRRLWAVNPVLANLDGLVDYAEDYTDAATVIENMQTVYQVGKGMFDKFAELVDTGEDAETTDVAEADDATPESSEKLQCEEDIAAHNDYSQKRKTSFQLTQGDNLGQSDEEDVDTLDLQDSALDEPVEEPRITRRRIRFDYS
ncbi:DUF3306 domain-containing protein [Roseibium sp. Sym1]|uniref:DUF3306 domain-containing protein n=1 Tax=Roseibium sp. Sym1 TaxID=3016006 RepID=UPI0022B36113|nr:DUF3306 domain-containing protein [Roseibium sp. Sym1]